MARTEELDETSGFGETNRTDNWWSHPLVVFIGLSLFVVYGLFRTVYPVLVPEAPGISHESLLSPFFAPLLFSLEPSHHAVFGTFPEGWPRLLRSPAILILWAPLGLRATCYYYRKAYYRAFFQDPTACAVSEPREDYEGETGLLVFQNLHRYFLYLGLLFIVFLTIETVRALFWNVPGGAPFWHGDVEVHVGTLVLAVNTFLLAGYTLGCHSLRYLAGGNLRCFSCPNNPHNRDRGTDGDRSIANRYSLWKAVTKLNVNHPTWAWFSLFMVAFADFYVWMVSIGVWPDYTLFAL
jgi:hypothetical protein